MKYEIISDDILVDFLVNCQLLKKCKTVSVFTYTDVNAREVGEHEISVGNQDAKRSGFQLIECSLTLSYEFSKVLTGL